MDTAVVKATIVGERLKDSASLPVGEPTWSAFTAAGALEPLYDPGTLCMLVEHSNALRQNVDAYATNIDGFGHRLEPAIDFDADDANQRVAQCIYLERLAAQERGELPPDSVPVPTSEEVLARRAELTQLAQVEKARLEGFLEFCCFDHSFVDLRRKTRQDLEVTGNAFWEILRNARGEIAKLVYVPSYTVRLLPLDNEVVDVMELVRVSPVTVQRVPARRRLRRYVQIQYTERVYFKALGDPRVVSRKTGLVFESTEALRRENPGDGPATEVLHFAIHSPRSPYGVPRWVGTLLSVLGSRQMEEVNHAYFENKSVPPLALLVSGGRLSEASVPRIERFVEENIKGKNNFHRLLILEAEGAGSNNEAARAKIELHPLTQAQQRDALFSDYDQANMDKIGGAFRLPRLLRGDSREFNRSVADAQLRFAEDQVFQPERDEFDFLINRKLLADMGIRFWRFRSQTPVVRDPERMTNMVEKLMRAGVLIPEEGRTLAGDIFNREFQHISADWVRRPITLTLAGLQNQLTDLQSKPDQPSVVEQAKRLISLREEILAEETRLAERRMELAKDYQEPELIRVPDEEFRTWFEEGAVESK